MIILVCEVVFSGVGVIYVDEMIDVVWSYVDSWGFVGYNVYWKFEIYVIVFVDGEM